MSTQEGAESNLREEDVETPGWTGVCQAKGSSLPFFFASSGPKAAPHLSARPLKVERGRGGKWRGSPPPKSTGLALLTLFSFLLGEAFSAHPTVSNTSHGLSPLLLQPFLTTCHWNACLLTSLCIFCDLNLGSTRAIVYFVHCCILWARPIFNE